MQTQIQCQQCGAPIIANVEQIIDVDQTPQLKQLLLSGALNMAQCRNCGWATRVAMPLVYHDSEHDLLISYVPMELNMPYDEQERMMGQLVRRVVDGVPQEKRRAYLLQPKQIMRWQTFLETVLETEGITPEMIERQRNQSELLRTLMRADEEVVNVLLDERADEIDETFVAMVQQALQAATQADQRTETINLSNLLAHLMRETEAGQRIEKRQLAVRALSRDAQKAQGLSPELFAEHIVRNRDSDDTIDALVSAVGTLNYEFFSALSSKIDQFAKQGDREAVERLTAIRTRLLKLYDDMRQASDQAVRERLKLINRLVKSSNKRELISQNGENVDELFMAVLDNELQQAERDADLERTLALRTLSKLIDDMMEESIPPQIRLISNMLEAQDDAQVRAVLAEHPEMLNEELLQLIDAVSASPEMQPEVQQRLREIRGIVSARISLAAA